jgi:putative PIN family toxin of toxin-antitoxin system
MMKVVLDTNVLASGFVHRLGNPGRILALWRSHDFQLVVSGPILAELEATLEDRYFQMRLTRQQRERALSLLRRQAEHTEITARVEGIATHKEDDLILATARTVGADVLVTGDEGLQRVRTYGGTEILSPAEFLRFLEEAGGV